MSKEKQIRKYESKQLIDELSKMPPMVIATAYLHAINYTLYGEDVTMKGIEVLKSIGRYDMLPPCERNES